MKAFRFITTVSLLALIKIVSATLVSDYVAEIFVSTLLILPNHLFAHIPNRMNLILALPTKITIYVASHPISSILMHVNLLA